MTTEIPTAAPKDSRYLVLDRQRPIPSERLFRQENEVRILHQGQEYRLRITRAGKLILTK
ncbi:hemin uptake protein HemP [Thiobacter aerophilum]|uniref:Hemin uptake protein HemP n=1 Tax=Thiobacter aerophilum TaxID=3121275 RepID=A0ABV0EFI5_9BURK